MRTGGSFAAGATLLSFLNVSLIATTIKRTALLSAPLENDKLKKSEGAIVADDWLLWQLADSAFPTGGFAHSGGLEAAWQHREVRNSGDLKEFVQASLIQLKNGMLPFMLTVFENGGAFQKCDENCDAFLTNHVANRASRLQGKALSSSARRIFAHAQFEMRHELSFGHLAPVFGMVMRGLNVERTQAIRLFLFWHLRGWVASAVRLGLIGPMEAQAVQFELGTVAEKLVQSSTDSNDATPTQTAPLLDIWQGAQDRLYSRLFQS